MLTPTISPAAHAPGANRAPQNNMGDKDIFLKLLVAQMQYQDPMKPQDATQMSSQLAQFNMVEQQTESNKLLQQLVGAGGSSSSPSITGGGADYLGHSVTANQDEIHFNGSDQNFSVVLDEPASQALVFIFNADGEPVRTMNLSNLAAGANPVVWDGFTDSGATAAQGNYSVQVTATHIDGGNVGYVIQRSGIVDAVRFTANGTEFMVNGVAASQNDITEIRL